MNMGVKALVTMLSVDSHIGPGFTQNGLFNTTLSGYRTGPSEFCEFWRLWGQSTFS